jgi:murein DD-endopeptidase MepM/ murein hydrolase activator NlpD
MKYIAIFALASLFFISLAARGESAEPRVIRPGEIHLLEFTSAKIGALIYCRDIVLPARHKDGKYLAFVSESYFSKLAPFTCVLKLGDETLAQATYRVEPTTYEVETLKVSPKQVKLSEKDQKRVDEEQVVLKKIYSATSSELETGEQAFHAPLKSKITSPYGIKRVFNGEIKGQHIGIDFRAAIGTKIRVANAGRVAFAGQLLRSGNLVIVDHGLGVFTQYHHLSKILTKVGARVKRDQVIGLAGNTGRVSGPHLHWGVNIHGELVDGFSLVKETEEFWKTESRRRTPQAH